MEDAVEVNRTLLPAFTDDRCLPWTGKWENNELSKHFQPLNLGICLL